MKLLTFSTLYPNIVVPRHGVFVETRLQHLLATNEVESRVVAPVPWFPWSGSIFGEYGKYRRIPDKEEYNNIQVNYPRYVAIPKIGMNITPFLMAMAVLPEIKRIIKSGYDVDIIDAHYFYPDGVAAILIGKIINKPVVITARGTDLNLIPKFTLPRKMILWAAKNSDGMITVCKALKDVIVDLGVESERVRVLRNGVDLVKFTPPENREVLRKKIGFEGHNILSVGHLIERKGHHLIIEAIQYLPEVNLWIAGEGSEDARLRRLVDSLNLSKRVHFLGALSQEDLKQYYGAADALVLASSREGWANVLLEAMACGTPVVATNVWGTPEVVDGSEAGVLVKERTALSIYEGIGSILAELPDRAKTRSYAERFDWEETSQGQIDLFKSILNSRH